jgi:thiol-disulfide isomerase/thioredoxin
MRMKKKFLQSAVICIATLLFFNVAHAATANAHDIYDKPYHFETHKGKWIIINYWATWCQYCIEEIPELNKLAKALETLPAVFFAVNYDNASIQEQQAFAENHQINYLLLQNNPFASLVVRSPISTLPTTFIISPDGHVQELRGELRSSDVLDSIR